MTTEPARLAEGAGIPANRAEIFLCYPGSLSQWVYEIKLAPVSRGYRISHEPGWLATGLKAKQPG